MASDLRIKIPVKLDTSKIASEDVPKLNNDLANNKKAQAKIIGGLDLAKTQAKIQSQISTISKNLKIDIGLVNTASIQKSMEAVEKSVDKTVQNVSYKIKNIDTTLANTFKTAFNKDGQIDVVQTIENARKALSQFGTPTFSWGKGSSGELNRITAEVKSLTGQMETLKYVIDDTGENFYYDSGSSSEKGILKLIADIEKAKSKYTTLLSEFKSSNSGIESGLKKEIDTVNEAIDNLGKGGTIQDLESAFNALKTTANNIKVNLDTTSSSFNKVTNAENTLKTMPNTIQDITNKFQNLKEQPKEVKELIESLSGKLKDVQSTEGKFGRNVEWSKQYRDLVASVKEAETQIKSLQLLEKSDNSGVQQQAHYYQKMFNEIKQVNKLKKQLVNAGESESVEIQRQIKNLESRIRYDEKQLEKKKLLNDELTRQKNILKNIGDDELRLAEARSADNTNSTSTKVNTSVAKLSEDLMTLETRWKSSPIYNEEIQNKFRELQTQLNSVGGNPAALESYKVKLNELQNELNRASIAQKNAFADERSQQNIEKTKQDIEKLINTIKSYQNVNTKAMKTKVGGGSTYKDTTNEMIQSLQKLQNASDMTDKELRRSFQSINRSFATCRSEIKAVGLEGGTFFDILKEKVGKFGGWMSITTVITSFTSVIRSSINELKDVSTILTEISKTSDLTDQQLEALGTTAYDTAHKYGAAATEYLTGVQEMYRAGKENAEQLAEISLLAQTAGDLSADVANDYILATDAAYNLKGSSEELTKILDGQNQVTNNNAVSMSDLAAATSEAASMAAQSGVEIDQLTSLIATATSRTRESGEETGTAIKSLLVNLQDTTNKQIVKTFEQAGISMTEFVDGSEKLKTPIELLKELSTVYNALPEGSTLRANILSDIGGKYHANTLSAILSGWSDYEKILGDYANGTGSAMREAEKSANNWEGSINKVNDSWTSFIQNFTKSDDIITFLGIIDKAVNKLDDLIQTLGLAGTAFTAFTAYKSFKNEGMFRYDEDTGVNIFNSFKKDNVDWSGLDEGTQKVNEFISKVQEIKNIDNEVSMKKAFTDLFDQAEDFNFDYITDAAKDFDVMSDSVNNLSDKAFVNLYAQNLKNTTGFNGVRSSIEAYNNAVNLGGNAAKNMATAIGTTNKTLGTYLTNLNGATATLPKYIASLVKVKTATILLQTATMALNMVLSYAVSYVISRLIESYQKAKNAAKELAEQNKQLAEENKQSAEKYKQEYESMAELIRQYQQLGTQASLTQSDKEKLVNIQKELVDTYGVEAEKLDLVNGKYKDNLAILEETARKKAFAYDAVASNVYLNADAATKDNKANTISSYERGIIQKWNGYKYTGNEELDTTLDEIQAFLLTLDGFKKTKTDSYIANANLDQDSNLNGNRIRKVETYDIFLDDVSSEEKIKYLEKAIDELDKNREKLMASDEKEYRTIHTRLANLHTYYQEEVNAKAEATKGLANSEIYKFTSDNGVSYLNVAEDTYAEWAQALITTFRDNNGDPEVEKAIIDNLNSYFGGQYGMLTDADGNITFDSIQEQLEKIKSVFNFETFFEDENINFDDTIKSIETLKTAYKNLVDGKEIDKVELFKEFPDLRAYANDTEKLRGKLVQIANTKSSELINQLLEFLPSADDKTKKEILNLIEIIQSTSNLAGAETLDTQDNLETQKQLIQDKIDGIEKIIANLEEEKSAQEDILSALQSQKSELEDIISQYETAADTVISTIEEQKSAIEDKYNKEIEALQTENEERDRNIDLREKEIALDKAKNTQVRVYSASRGWTIQADSEIVKKAQKEYDNALNEKKIKELDAQRDAEIKVYDDYKKQWQDIVDSYKKSQDEMTTATILGSDWRERILSKDTGVINGFAANYQSYQDRLHNVIEPQIQDVQNIITSYEEQIKAQNILKSEQESALEVFEDSEKRYSKTVDKFTSDVDKLSEAATKGAEAIAKLAGVDINVNYATNGVNAVANAGENAVGSYADGGVIDKTGSANVHGTSSNPEVIFNSADAKKLYNMVRSMDVSNILPKIQNSLANGIMNKITEKITNLVNTNNQVSNNSYQWVLTGNNMEINNYEKFKGYMDRYMRECQMNLTVGKK